jgi:hypothetical protein
VWEIEGVLLDGVGYSSGWIDLSTSCGIVSFRINSELGTNLGEECSSTRSDVRIKL